MEISDFERVTSQFSQTSILMERGISRHLVEYAQGRLGQQARVLTVGDPHTMEAYGATHIAAGENWRQFTLSARPKPDILLAEHIRQEAASCDALVAIGSGTVNDLVKYAAHQEKKPYIVLATAPSMNGYASPNASLLKGRHKESFACTMPIAALLDVNILSEAPSRMIRAGIGDSLCRSTAQADWLLSHLLLDTPYDAEVFEWLMPYEKILLEHGREAAKGNREVISALASMLILSGLGMARAGGSYPASQGEHMIAHAMESLVSTEAFHGEQIAVTTLSMAERQTRILASDTPPELLDAAPGRTFPKVQIEQRLEKNWRQVRKQILAVTVPQATLYDGLAAAGCPLSPSAIGWKDAEYSRALNTARNHRNRFTFLDLD